MSPSTSIGHYRLLGKLGEGGMGAVYRATDTKLGRDVAIKVLPESFASDADRLARFTNEAQVLASLNHPNIAAIYGVEERALVMELVEGAEPSGPMAEEQALPIVHQLIDALEYAHEKGVVHRDLKPANLKVTPDGRLKVLDFGLAKAFSSETPASNPANSPTLTMRATAAGMILGTAAYMSPEQARGQAVDKRADIWSFGVVVYELLTGSQLFAGDTVSDILAAVLKNDPDLTVVPARFRRLLKLCLTRDPRQRLRDISGARLLLEDTPGPVVPRQSRSKLPWIVAAVSLLAAAAFGFLWLRTPVATPRLMRFTLDVSEPVLFSPDGRWMLLLSKSGLQVRPVDGAGWRRLVGAEAAGDAFWSPDSSTIAYFANGMLSTIALDGAARHTLTPAPDPGGGSWHGGLSDGLILFSSAGRLHTYDLRSNRVGEVSLRLKESEIATSPVFCPESDHFLYVLRPKNFGFLGSAYPVYAASLTTKDATGELVIHTPYHVTFARHPHNGEWRLFYVSREESIGIGNRALMSVAVDPRTGVPKGAPVQLTDAMSNLPGTFYAAFDVAEGGIINWRNTGSALPIWRLYWFDRNGNTTGAVGERAGYSSVGLAPNGSWIAATVGYPIWQIWIYNPQTGASRRLTSLPGAQSSPVWSPDSRSIYFSYQTEAGWQVVRQSVESGSAPEFLLPEPTRTMMATQDISPDGRHLLFMNGRDGQVVGLDLSQPPESRRPEVLLTTVARVRFAPDGHSLALADFRGLYSMPYPPRGERQQIGDMGGDSWPFFSQDGKQLYALADGALFSFPVTNVPGGGIRLGERSLLFRVYHGRRTDVNVGAVTKEGRFLVLATDQPETAQFQVLSDWTSMLQPTRP